MERLARLLSRIDGRGYPAYKDLRGEYRGEGLSLHVDHVQGDPFAEPSKLRLRVPAERAAFPDELQATRAGRVALRDLLARRAARAVRRLARGSGRGSGKSGLVLIDSGGQEVLERSAVILGEDFVELRLQVGLPAAGRRVLGREAEGLLLDDLPWLAEEALLAEHHDPSRTERFVRCVENQEDLRSRLADLGLVAFVADGSLLPRASGVSDRPLGEGGVPWRAPEELAVEVELAHPLPDGTRRVRGCGLRPGVTLIVGGGYHGKSTLLRSLERGVYPHVPGDGRELVVTDPRAVKVRAEDGRRVEGVDISPFIADLPGGRATTSFRSDDASGSTSQAASIVEALEVGARVLLLDEDSSATNFLIRDARMQELVAREHEPITPFVDRVRELHERLGVSTVQVMGGSGDYLDVADTVLLMKDFLPEDASEAARAIADRVPSSRRREVRDDLALPCPIPATHAPTAWTPRAVAARSRSRAATSTSSPTVRSRSPSPAWSSSSTAARRGRSVAPSTCCAGASSARPPT